MYQILLVSSPRKNDLPFVLLMSNCSVYSLDLALTKSVRAFRGHRCFSSAVVIEVVELQARARNTLIIWFRSQIRVHKLNILSYAYCYRNIILRIGDEISSGEMGLRKRPIAILWMIVISVFTAASYIGEQAAGAEALQTGPYVDDVCYKVIHDSSVMRQQLIDGGIEMTNSFLDPFQLSDIQATSDVEIHSQPRNGYDLIVMNCLMAPMNWSGFRRAFAYAFDKNRAVTEMYGGYGFVHDSLVPKMNDFCIEDDLPHHYYDARPDIGNMILDDLGFSINHEGYRNDPNGNPIYIVIKTHNLRGQVAAMIAADALDSLYIAAESYITYYNTYVSNLASHCGYDMIVSRIDFYDDKVDWLAYEYWSAKALIAYENLPAFQNATYDSWRDQLLYGETYEEVYEAAAEMQKILHHNVPILVTCQNLRIQGYRTNQFQGYVADELQHISGPWTMRNIRAIDGSRGGSVTIGTNVDPRSLGLNLFRYYDSHWSRSAKAMMELQYSSLFNYGPDSLPVPDLATNWTIETHSDDASIPEENKRFTFDIIQNATWSNGVPLTAEDVVFTLLFLRLMQPTFEFFKIKRHWSYNHLKAAYSPTPYRVVFEYSIKSYWLFPVFAYMKVLPAHIINDDTIIGQWDWSEWGPLFNSEHQLPTSGPFVYAGFGDIVEGASSFEHYNFTANPNYYYAPPRPQTPTTTPTTTDGTVMPPELTIAITFGSMLVIVVFIGEFIRLSPKKND